MFGNTYWKQRNGTAMGTSCAVNYAFIYVGLLEIQELLFYFKPWLKFYARFIDDGIELWNTTVPNSTAAWYDFKKRINQWGTLSGQTLGMSTLYNF